MMSLVVLFSLDATSVRKKFITVNPRSSCRPKMVSALLPALLVRFNGFMAGIVQPFFCDGGSPLTVGTGFDGFKAEGQIIFSRAPIRACTGMRRPVLQIVVGRDDGAFNRPRRFRQLGFQFRVKDRMPGEVFTLNQFDGGAVRVKILEQRGVFVAPLGQRSFA